MDKTIKIPEWLMYVIALVIVALMILMFTQRHNAAKEVIMYENNLKTTKNELKQSVTTNNLISESFANFKYVSEHTTQHADSEMTRLRSLVNKLTLSATSITAKTNEAIDAATTITFDTSSISDENQSPIYSSTVSTEWDTIRVVASRYATHISYVMLNKFDIKQSRKRVGLFKHENYVEVTSLNPHTETIGLRSFIVQDSKLSRFGIGACAGVTLDNAFKIRPSITVGLTYSLFSF